MKRRIPLKGPGFFFLFNFRKRVRAFSDRLNTRNKQNSDLKYVVAFLHLAFFKQKGAPFSLKRVILPFLVATYQLYSFKVAVKATFRRIVFI
jgi:hypothetical protein